jgi:predicted enzyme related to lactoylglutathione lyase
MPGRMNYFELGSPDPEATRNFYGPLFDWRFGEPGPQGYGTVDQDAGGLWDTTAIGGGTWAIFYLQVDDVQATVARAVELGATVAMPAVDNGAIVFAHLLDPHGNRIGIWKPNAQPAS